MKSESLIKEYVPLSRDQILVVSQDKETVNLVLVNKYIFFNKTVVLVDIDFTILGKKWVSPHKIMSIVIKLLDF